MSEKYYRRWRAFRQQKSIIVPALAYIPRALVPSIIGAGGLNF
jgi:hypothetical protein